MVSLAIKIGLCQMADVFLVNNVMLYFEWRDGRGRSCWEQLFQITICSVGFGMEEEVSIQVRYFYYLSSWSLFLEKLWLFHMILDMRKLWSSVQGMYVGNKAMWRQNFLTSQRRVFRGLGNILPKKPSRDRQAGLPNSKLLCSVLSVHMDWF